MPRASHQPASFIRSGAIDISYSRYGDGPLLVLLHGFPDHEGTFAAQVEEFSRDHLVVTPRLRGFPPSSAPAGVESYALPKVAEDVAAIIEHFGQGPAVVVGHDWGGALAQAVAIRFPHLVKGIALLNAPVLSTFDSVVHGDPVQQAMSAYTLPYLQYRPGDHKNVEFVTRNIRNPAWRHVITRYLDETPIEGMLAYYKANYAAPPYRPQEPAGYRFGLPCLMVWGTEEEYFAPRVLDGLTRYFSAPLRLTTVPGAGHWVHQDAPDRVNQEIRSWLAVLALLRHA
jgi:pimeloyl-ACP methyl ester carboxylesterase